MKKQVLRTIKQNNLFSPGDKVVVAVSGGPDSLCLLHVLHRFAMAIKIRLHVVHIHHGLRPEADDEARQVKKMSLSLRLPVTVYRADVRAYAERYGYSLQQAARAVRYSCLAKTARRTGASSIATAHHMDDLAETVLLRLLSGSGLDGLAGIPVSRELTPGIRVVRPLLHITRRQVEEYCWQHQLKPAHDASNESLAYMRNRVRLRVLPFLQKEFGSHVAAKLAAASKLLAADSSLLKKLARDALQKISRREEGGIVLDVAGTRLLPRPLQMRVVRLAMWQAGADRPGAAHVEAVLSLLHGHSPSASCSLPGKVTAAREYGEILFSKGSPVQKKLQPKKEEIELQVPGYTDLPWAGLSVFSRVLDRAAVTLPPQSKKEAYLDFDRLRLPLFVRPRAPGDKMKPLGGKGSRKIKKILIDKKVPREQREMVPLFISDGEIAWLGGVEIGHTFRVLPSTRQVLHLSLAKRSVGCETDRRNFVGQ